MTHEMRPMVGPDINRVQPVSGQLVAWNGYAVLATDHQGQIGRGTEGFFLHQTRFLSRLRLSVNEETIFASAGTPTQRTMSAYWLAAADGEDAVAGPADRDDGGGEIRQRAIEAQINSFVGGGLHLDIHLTNHGVRPAAVRLRLDLAADFADQDEATRGERQQDAPVERRWRGGTGDGTLRFRYRHPELAHETMLRVGGADEALDTPGGILLRTMVEPGRTRTLFLDLAVCFRGEWIEPFHGLDGTLVRQPSREASRTTWLDHCASLSTSNAAVQSAWSQGQADLASLLLLDGHDEERFTPAAGMPSFAGLFGRDALFAAQHSAMLTPLTPLTLRGTLRTLRRHIARERDDTVDAEPGKILHQRMLGPLALLNKTPFRRYYGDHSAPMLFLLGAALDLAWTGDRAFLRDLLPDLQLVLD